MRCAATSSLLAAFLLICTSAGVAARPLGHRGEEFTWGPTLGLVGAVRSWSMHVILAELLVNA
eukprot:scaffold140811_cov17-Tisochrysis_lutea.AAC.1